MQPIGHFGELMEIDYLPGEDTDTYQTLGGFVMMKPGRVPKAGGHFRGDDLESRPAYASGAAGASGSIDRLNSPVGAHTHSLPASPASSSLWCP